MKKTTFKINPQSPYSSIYVEVDLEIKEISQVICKGAFAKKLQYTLIFRNNNFSLKHNFEMAFRTDTDTTLICDSPNGDCGIGGKREQEVYFPLKNQYWRGDTKRIVQFLCWIPDVKNPDFNLNIEISLTPYSQDLEPDELDALRDSISMNIYGEEVII